MKRLHIILVIALLVSALLPVEAVRADRPRLKKPSELASKPRKPTLVALVPRLTAGKLTGDASRLLGDEMSDKMVYGLGLSAEYSIRPGIAAGITFDMLWKDLPLDNVNSIRVMAFGLCGLVRFAPKSRNSGFARMELGMARGALPDYFSQPQNGTTDLLLGTHPFVRIGIGITSYPDVRLEFYYRNVFCKGHRLDQLFWYNEIPYNANQIGLEVAFGIRLK